jgi:PncC family amidohydrolase
MSDLVAALAERVLKKATAAGVKLATAESCTAGCLSTLSADGGFVTYTKESKIATLGVPRELIAAYTAVSRPVAEAMATGALERCPAASGTDRGHAQAGGRDETRIRAMYVHAAQQVVLGDATFEPELVEQTALVPLLPPHHRRAPAAADQSAIGNTVRQHRPASAEL